MGVKRTTHPNLNKNETSKCNHFQKGNKQGNTMETNGGNFPLH